jgi:hypothetical protein
MPNFSGTLAALRQRPDLADAMYQFKPDGVRFAADEVFPVVSVPEQAGTIEVVTTESLLNIPNVARAPGGHYNEINEYLTATSYNCSDKGLEIADKHGFRHLVQYNHEVGKVTHLMLQMRLAREKTVMDAVFNTTTWANMITTPAGSGTGRNWASDSSTPVADVITAKQAVRDRSGVIPNAVVMSGKTLNRLLVHPNVVKYFQNSDVITPALVEAALARVLNVERIIVSDAVYNTAAEGLTANLSSIASDDYVNVCRVGSDPTSPAIGFTFLWQEDSASPYIVENYDDLARRATIYRCRHNTDERVTEAKFGQLIKIAGHGA